MKKIFSEAGEQPAPFGQNGYSIVMSLPGAAEALRQSAANAGINVTISPGRDPGTLRLDFSDWVSACTFSPRGKINTAQDIVTGPCMLPDDYKM